MYFTLNGQFDNVNNELRSTLWINSRGHWQQQAAISVARVIAEHYNRGHIGPVSGHLTICTQTSTRAHYNIFHTAMYHLHIDLQKLNCPFKPIQAYRQHS